MNYTFFPENLINLRYDEDVTWFVTDRRDWDNNIISGLTFSSFSVVISCVKISSLIIFSSFHVKRTFLCTHSTLFYLIYQRKSL